MKKDRNDPLLHAEEIMLKSLPTPPAIRFMQYKRHAWHYAGDKNNSEGLYVTVSSFNNMDMGQAKILYSRPTGLEFMDKVMLMPIAVMVLKHNRIEFNDWKFWALTMPPLEGQSPDDLLLAQGIVNSPEYHPANMLPNFEWVCRAVADYYIAPLMNVSTNAAGILLDDEVLRENRRKANNAKYVLARIWRSGLADYEKYLETTIQNKETV